MVTYHLLNRMEDFFQVFCKEGCFLLIFSHPLPFLEFRWLAFKVFLLPSRASFRYFLICEFFFTSCILLGEPIKYGFIIRVPWLLSFIPSCFFLWLTHRFLLNNSFQQFVKIYKDLPLKKRHTIILNFGTCRVANSFTW